MLHFHNLDNIQLENSWVTIGSFDGVHVGHQQIIRNLVEGAHRAGLPAAVITFYPHPQLVIHQESRPYYLTLPEERAQLLGSLGVDIVLTYPFNQKTSQMTALDFISMLHARFNFSELWVGHDFALGRNREGTPDRLRELGGQFGFKVHEIPPYTLQDELVSSSRIRKYLRDGNVREAAVLLGRPFEITGMVVKGENRGKSLGFATSNLMVDKEMAAIKPGVYACLAKVQGETWQAVTNIGFRPTFGEGIQTPRVEAHLLGFSKDLYGEQLVLSFIERLRDEKKFNQVSDLIAQIKEDIAQAQRVLAG